MIRLLFRQVITIIDYCPDKVNAILDAHVLADVDDSPL